MKKELLENAAMIFASESQLSKDNTEAKYPKATDCLVKDKAEMLAFYDYPAEHYVRGGTKQHQNLLLKVFV